MLEGVWWFAASPAVALGFGLFIIYLLMRGDYHRAPDGSIGRRRLASVFVLGASSYTFGVMVLSQLVFHGPDVSVLAEKGFGNIRVAYLLSGVFLDGLFRIWDEFRPL